MPSTQPLSHAVDDDSDFFEVSKRRKVFAEEQRKLRRAELENLHKLISEPESWVGNSKFALLVGFVVELGISQTTIAKSLETNTGTVSRWASGDSRPAKYVRPTVIGRVRDAIELELGRIATP